ncbi:TPA: hypothetical protein SMQ04_000173 [Pseudomonas putida]|nr:hypothetical protein [Pseudomonas putida]
MTFPLIYVITIGGYVIQNAVDLSTGRRAGRAFNVVNGQWSPWGREAFLTDFGTAAFAALTTSANDPNPGRVLKVGDYGIGGDVPNLGAADLNNLTVPPGPYFVAAPANGPDGIVFYGFLDWKVRGETQHQRLVYVGTGIIRTFERIKTDNATGWRAWVETTPLGHGQLWYNLTPNRVIGTTYRNATGRAIQLAGLFGPTSSANVSVYVNILGPDGTSNAVTVRGGYSAAVGNYIEMPEILIPHNCYYSTTIGNGTAALIEWREMR